MSHFTVAVIQDGTKTLEELLLPYMENCCDEPPKQYMEFYDEEDEYRKEYETDLVKMVKTTGGGIKPLYSEEFEVVERSEYGTRVTKHRPPEGAEVVEVKASEAYPDFEQYMREVNGMRRDPDKGRYGYWQNPNARWDWWVVGGRWSGMLNTPDGPRDEARIGDVSFETSDAEVEKAGRFWDIYVDGKDEGAYPHEWHSPEFYVKLYGAKERYVLNRTAFHTHAVVTPDGEWHEKGEMGWWGISSETHEEAVSWEEGYYDRFLKDADPDHVITIVDCHI